MLYPFRNINLFMKSCSFHEMKMAFSHFVKYKHEMVILIYTKASEKCLQNGEEMPSMSFCILFLRLKSLYLLFNYKTILNYIFKSKFFLLISSI